MFAPWCPSCRSQMLLSDRRVERLERTPDGPVATLRCYCGTTVTWPDAGEIPDKPAVDDHDIEAARFKHGQPTRPDRVVA